MPIWGGHVFVLYLKYNGLFKAKVPKSAHFALVVTLIVMHNKTKTKGPQSSTEVDHFLSSRSVKKKRVQVQILRLSEVSGQHSWYQPKAQTICEKIWPKGKNYMHEIVLYCWLKDAGWIIICRRTVYHTPVIFSPTFSFFFLVTICKS